MGKLLSILVVLILLSNSACSVFRKKQTKEAARTEQSLNGNWVLKFVPYPQAPFDSLYKFKKPTINFDLAEKKFSGYTGCNNYNGPLVIKNDSISFKGDILMTMKACLGKGESVYLENLKRVNKYAVSPDGKILNFIQGDVAIMHYQKVEE